LKTRTLLHKFISLKALVITFLLVNHHLYCTNDFQFIISGNHSKVDSITKIAQQTKNIAQSIEANNLLGAYYESISNYPKAFYHLRLAQQLNTSDKNEQIFTYNYIGYVFWHQSEYDSSLFYHNKALAIAQKEKLINSNVAFTYLMLGSDYYDLGDYIKTSEYFFESLKLYEKLNDLVGQIQTNNRLSKLYYKLKDYKKAKNHVTAAQQLNQKIQYHREMATSFNSIGNIQIETGSLNSALYYFSKTLVSFKKCGDIIGQSIACINLGDTYNSLYKTENSSPELLDSSFVYYQKSYELNKVVDNKFGMIYGLWGMADIEMKKGNIKAALIIYEQALQLSKQINAKSEEYNLYWKLYNAYDLLNVKDSSFYYLKNYVEVKNSLENEEQTNALLR
jgi:tetratricopeptide (TPR) repeat protein